jgi:hypothetical protein
MTDSKYYGFTGADLIVLRKTSSAVKMGGFKTCVYVGFESGVLLMLKQPSAA